MRVILGPRRVSGSKSWDGEPRSVTTLPFLIPPDPAIPLIVFVPVPEGKSVKNRLHIDVSPTDGTRDQEVERLLAIGATRADIGQGDVDWVVLRDPEGNEFCVLGGQADPDLRNRPWPGME